MRTLTREQLGAAAALSALAGYVDAIAFIYLGGFFVSFMSGNTTQGAVELVEGGTWAIAFLLVGAFVVGVILGTVVSMARVRPGARVLGVVTVLLLVGTLLAGAGVERVIPALFVAAGMGAVNTVFMRDGQSAIGLTYMTGALVRMSQELVAAVTGGSRTAWLRHLALWLAIGLGAVLGAVAYGAWGVQAMWASVAVAAGATVVTAIRSRS